MALKIKKDFDYFDCFNRMSTLSVKASKQLQDLLNDYVDIAAKAERIHDTEHEADEILHNLVFELSRSFITPIDREDILQIGNNIDDIIDHIEDISNMLDMYSVEIVREAAKVMVGLIVDACVVLEKTISGFKNFRKAEKELKAHIIEINHYEEEADRFYRATIKELYKTETNPKELAIWKEIFDTMEDTLDTCEDVANLLEAIAIKNN